MLPPPPLGADGARGASILEGVPRSRTIGGLIRIGSLRRSGAACGVALGGSLIRGDSVCRGVGQERSTLRRSAAGSRPLLPESRFGSNRRQLPLSVDCGTRGAGATLGLSVARGSTDWPSGRPGGLTYTPPA